MCAAPPEAQGSVALMTPRHHAAIEAHETVSESRNSGGEAKGSPAKGAEAV